MPHLWCTWQLCRHVFLILVSLLSSLNGGEYDNRIITMYVSDSIPWLQEARRDFRSHLSILRFKGIYATRDQEYQLGTNWVRSICHFITANFVMMDPLWIPAICKNLDHFEFFYVLGFSMLSILLARYLQWSTLGMSVTPATAEGEAP